MRAADHSNIWRDASKRAEQVSKDFEAKGMALDALEWARTAHHWLIIAQAYREEAERNPE